ncbi:MAG TPA: ABC transporter permease [Longimicrobiales bacterium]|nr:ABC transporter permease [Longimicrobiales bacterium]
MSAPRWARALLRLCVPEPRLEDVLGDLDEMHHRRLAAGNRVSAWVGTSAEAVAVAAAFLRYRWRDRDRGAFLPSLPEFRLALRLARRQPVLNVTAVLALATGLGLSTGAFTLMGAFLFPTVPLPAGDRLVRFMAAPSPDDQRGRMSRARFAALKRDASVLEYLGAYRDGTLNILGEDDVEPVRGVYLSADAFRVLGYGPILGRTLLPGDALAGAPPVVVLRESLWIRRFGGDPDVLGRVLDLGGTSRQVVGVLPDDAGFPNTPDIWMPLGTDALGAEGTEGGAVAGIGLWGFLRPGATPETATARIEALSVGYEQATDGALPLRFRVVPFTMVPQGGLMQALLAGMLSVIVAVLLVIAANVGNLVSARTAARRGELAVRTALGASRGRLVVQLFLEVLVLGAVAAVVAWGGTRSAMGWIARSVDEMPFWVDFTPGPGSLTFLAASTLLACVVAGVLPALRATSDHVGATLRATAWGGGALGRGGAAMAILQVAASVALLGTALVAVRGLDGYARAKVDVPTERILTTGFWVGGRGADSAGTLLQRVEEATARIPGVRSVGVASALPRIDPPAPPVVVESAPGAPEGEARPAPVVQARPGFLEALGAGAVMGRLLAPEDLVPGAPRVAVVNESFVRKFLGGGNPLGRRIRSADPRTDEAGPPLWREIVGVVPDLGLSVGDPELAAGYYVPMDDAAWVYMALHVSGDAVRFTDPLRRAVAEVAPDLILTRVHTLDRAGQENVTALGMIAAGLTVLGGMTLLLSLASTYALVAFTVSRRVREIGVRVALGASGGNVVRSVVGRASLHLAAGGALGMALGAVLLQLKSGLFVFRVPSGDPWVLPLVAALMVAAGAAASWIPALRALRISPVEALRSE